MIARCVFAGTGLRLLWRQFCKSPVGLLACIAVLALGIGGTTTAFSALHAVALQPLPYADPEQLVAVHSQFPRLQMNRLGVSPMDYLDLRQSSNLFRSAGAFYYLDLTRTGQSRAEKVNAVAITRSMFTTLDVRPAFGRAFKPEEERLGGQHVVLLSYQYWRSEFGADQNALNRVIHLNGEPYVIVGVMPPSFAFPNEVTQMWVPLAVKPQWLIQHGRQNVFLHMYARLRNGVPFEWATRQLDVISRRAAVTNRGDYTVDLTGWRYFLVPLHDDENASLQSWTWILFWSVSVVFLIVCVNVGGLLMLRSKQRAFEVSVRLALGGSIAQVVRDSILETAFICTAGALGGTFIALGGMKLLNSSEQFGHLQLSLPVLLFGVGLAFLSGLICCLYPLWQAVGANPSAALSAGGHQRTESHRDQSVRRTLVVVQIAASTVLLIVGGLMLHTYARLLQTPLGFDPDHVMTLQISLPPLRYASETAQRAFYDTLLERVRHIPGIRGASACTVLPFGYAENVEPFAIAGQPATTAQQLASVNNVASDFFSTLRIPLLAGKLFRAGDRNYSVIVDQKFANRYFPHQDAVNHQIRMGDRLFSIVGIVGNTKVSGLDVSETPMLYLDAEQMPRTDMSLVVKGDTSGLIPGLVQSIVSKIDLDQPVYDVAPLESRIDGSLATRRFVTFLLASFSGVGIVITALGLYGLLTHATLTRRQEFGIRSAVGATSRDLGFLVLASGMRLVGMGALTGSAVALAASRYISAELLEVQLADPATWMVVFGTLAGTGILSSVVPAWQASKSDPATLLKQS